MSLNWKLGLGFALAGTLVACSGDDSSPEGPDNRASSNANGVAAGDAVGDLLHVSSLTAGGVANAARAGVTEVELEAYLGDLLSQLDRPDCLDASVTGDSSVRIDFDGCRIAGDAIDGSLELELLVKATSVELLFVGDVEIDGCSFDGQWSASVDQSGAIRAGGDLRFAHGQDVLDVEFDGSWSYAVGDFCPSIDLNVTATSAQDSVVLEIRDLDVCLGLCAPGVVVDLDGFIFTPADGAVTLDGTVLSCVGGDIDLEDAPGNDDPSDDPQDDPEDPSDDPTTYSPRTGAWSYDAYTPVSNNCDFADELDSAQGFGLTNNGDGSFTIHPGSNPFDCTLDGNSYYCPDAHNESALINGANLSASGTASGELLSDTRATGSRSITVNCTGPECALVAAARGATFPCTFQVSYEVSFESGL